MQPVNTIIYTKKDFGTYNNLYSKVANQIQLLIETGNTIVIRGEATKSDTIYIEYAPQNPILGKPYPYWLLPYEANYVAAYHDKIEIEKYKQIAAGIEAAEEEILNKDDGDENKGTGGKA